MAKKISALTEITTPTDSDYLVVVNGGANKKISKRNLTEPQISTVASTNALVYVCAGTETVSTNYDIAIASGSYLLFTIPSTATISSGDLIVYNSTAATLKFIHSPVSASKTETTLTTTAESTATGTTLTTTPTYWIDVLTLKNYDYRLSTALASGTMVMLNMDGTFVDPYISEIVMTVSTTAPTVAYAGTNIIQWIGTHCTIDDGVSTFEPHAGYKYNIIFTYDGTNFEGLVNGFVPATEN